MTAKDTARAAAPIAALVVLSAVLLGIRIYAAAHVGFGDSEALYACYALHPQPAYLDHPGLIGLFARAIGSRGAPSPWAAHEVTAVLATAIPWLGALAARQGGATWRGAAIAGMGLAVTPELAVGLFAMTPDLLLCLAWLSSLALAAAGLTAPPKSLRASLCLLFAGLAAGVSASAKVSGLALVLALGATYLTRRADGHARTIAPWAGLAAGLVVLVPVGVFEAHNGWPMLRHRLVDTQAAGGFSFRNVGALLGGQLVYLSPVVAVLAFFVARDLVKRRAEDGVSTLLFFSFLVPFTMIVPLCLWSRVAEPHWLAPAYLALFLHFGRRVGSVDGAALWRRLRVAAGATALVLVLAVHAWVLIPALARLAPRDSDPRYDIANELYGWPEVSARVREIVAEEISAPGEDDRDHDEIVVVGPHWTVCAQLHAALGRAVPVGCATSIPDDFDDWYPRAFWRRAPTIVFVTDNRFPTDLQALFPHRAASRVEEVSVTRGDRVVRTFHITVLEKAGAA